MATIVLAGLVFVWMGMEAPAAGRLINLIADAGTIYNQQASNDATNVYYQFSYKGGPYTFNRVYIDTDQSQSTGFPTGGIGANYLLENAYLYRYSGQRGAWGWTLVKRVSYSNANRVVAWIVARADIGETATPNASDLIFQTESPLYSTAKWTHTFGPGTTTTSTSTTSSSTTTSTTSSSTTTSTASSSTTTSTASSSTTTSTTSSSTTTSTTSTSTTTTTLPAAAPYWKPTVGLTWDWQLATPINPINDAAVYDIDLFNNSAGVVGSLHAMGRKVICYVDVGSFETGRPDAGLFPASVLGATYSGFPDERWLDIRRINILGPIMKARLDLAKTMGCDAIEPDNIDGYDTTAHESTGFPLTYQDQLVYNRFIADEAHRRGMAVGLKNDINQVIDLVGDFDFAVSEQAFQYNEYQFFLPFISQGKPVFEAEYKLDPSRFCPQANSLQFSAIKKKTSLDSYRVSCR